MIKPSALAATLCIITTATSMAHANEHEQMMQNMMQMQRCISETVDMRYLEDMAANGEKMAKHIKQLCESDQRQQAQDSAMTYAKDLQSNPQLPSHEKMHSTNGQCFPWCTSIARRVRYRLLKENHVYDEL